MPKPREFNRNNTRDFNALKADNSTPDIPSDMVGEYLLYEENCQSLTQFISHFQFGSREEMERAIKVLCNAIVGDKFLANKRTQTDCPQYKAIYRRYMDVVSKAGSCDKFPFTRSSEIWHGEYGRKQLDARVGELLNGVPDPQIYIDTCARIKDVYSLTDTDIRKIEYFVQQVRARAEFPPSLRRMLYLWGKKKKTGKTTTAGCIVSILNGDRLGNISKYSTSLSTEMQIRSFAVPIISTCNVALMDECFYADMGKTYADFKRFITSVNGRARLPYGQEFEWKGQPNYVSTSNDPLKTFIKDWDDRRYLSVHFNATPQAMSFEDIYALWLDFCKNVPAVSDWKKNTIDIEIAAEEVGERRERTDEFVIELQQPTFTDRLMAINAHHVRFNAKNKITLKYFVDYFAQTLGTQEALKRRSEVENAVIQVYGERYSTSNYWLLPDLQSRVHDIMYNDTPKDDKVESEEKLPF